MCMGRACGTPNGGIPIQRHTHEQFPKEVQDAWEKFHNWVMEQVRPVSRASMPPDISEAYTMMKEAPIPGYEGSYGKDSCYVHGVEDNMVD